MDTKYIVHKFKLGVSISAAYHVILPVQGAHIPDGWLKQYGAFQQPLLSFSSAGMYWKDCCTGLKADLLSAGQHLPYGTILRY